MSRVVRFASVILTALLAGCCTSVGDQSQSLAAVAGGDKIIPLSQLETAGQKVTYNFGNMIFSHDGSGVHDASASNLLVQFVFNGNDVETVIQGVGLGVDYRLTIEWMSLSHKDTGGIVRYLVRGAVPDPSVFECRQDSRRFSWTGRAAYDLVREAMQTPQNMSLTIKPNLRTGIPGTGC